MSSSTARDQLYSFDEEKLDALKESKPWMKNPKHFKRVKISPSATIKMLMHGQSGVDNGIKSNGKPIEVMGLLLGRPDVEDNQCMIITDAQALPIEGFETRVVADDEDVVNYMIELGEMNEKTSKERFCGWYHTHPFDVDVNSHCYLSGTDVSTQLQWQRSEDPHGNPWLAIVIDPLRSLAKNRPELEAFRVYPPDFSAPANETPDGVIVTDDKLRLEKWGSCWNRYYSLEVTYFMSSLAQTTLGALKNNFMWMDTFSASPLLEPDNRQRVSERISILTDKLDKEVISHSFNVHGGSSSRATVGPVVEGGVEVALEHCHAQIAQISKQMIFGGISTSAEDAPK